MARSAAEASAVMPKKSNAARMPREICAKIVSRESARRPRETLEDTPDAGKHGASGRRCSWFVIVRLLHAGHQAAMAAAPST